MCLIEPAPLLCLNRKLIGNKEVHTANHPNRSPFV
jgi:hypothetical protein